MSSKHKNKAVRKDFSIELFGLNISWNTSHLVAFILLRLRSCRKKCHQNEEIEHSENKVVTQSGLFEIEIAPGALQTSVQGTRALQEY